MKQKKIFIYGKHAVGEALRNTPHLLSTVYLGPQFKDKEILDLIHKANLTIEDIDPRKVTSQVEGNAPHQGIIALFNLNGLVVPFEKFVESYKPEGLVVYLDGVGDPHNVGTIIRSAAAFGASVVLLSADSPVTGIVIKTSAGAAFSIPLVVVSNTQQALAKLRSVGVHIYGLAGEGSESVAAEKFEGATLFVLGNEAEGVSSSARALCEKMLRIPISIKVESLNVASAATAALYDWSTKNSIAS